MQPPIRFAPTQPMQPVICQATSDSEQTRAITGNPRLRLATERYLRASHPDLPGEFTATGDSQARRTGR